MHVDRACRSVRYNPRPLLLRGNERKAMRTAQCFITLAVLLGPLASPVSGADDAPPAATDYAWFYGTPTANSQTVVVIGQNFKTEKVEQNDCQTRSRSGEKVTDWGDAIEIVKAKEDEHRFKAAHNSASGEVIEVRVKGADGKYTAPAIVGDCTNYWERLLTSGSPHDALGKHVRIRWCKDPKPELGGKICPGTKHALTCKEKNDYVVVGIHFDAGTVSQVRISFEYTQLDLKNVGDKSNSVLRRALVTEDAECPGENKYADVQPLHRVCKPDPAKLECFPASDIVTPGPKDVAVYYMFKRKTWPAVLSMNHIRIETTMAPPAGKRNR